MKKKLKKQRREREKRTAFESFEPFVHVFFAALALLELLELHLLANLLAFALAPPRLALRNACTLVEQTLSDTLHVRVRLDHLGKEVVRPREWEVVVCGEGARGLCTV
jgi:hypothetical protein